MSSLALYADGSAEAALKSVERFTTVDAADQGINKLFTLISLLAIDIDSIYVMSSGKSTKLLTSTVPPEYTINGTTLSLNTAIAVGQSLYVVPKNCGVLSFIGNSSVVQFAHTPMWLRRGTLYDYGDISIYSVNLDTTAMLLQVAGTLTISTFVHVAGFTGLTVNALVGQAVLMDNTYIGRVVSNTATELILDSTSYATGAVGTVKVMSVGTLEFAIEQIGVVGPFKPVLNIALVDQTNAEQKIWVREALQLPVFSTTYANMAIKITATEYR